jgi:uncharacterized protein (TIGR03083 family)
VTNATDIRTQTPVGHDEAMAITKVEHDKFAALLASLHDGDWQKATDCDLWDVRGVACHVLGIAEMVASIKEARHQRKLGIPIFKEKGGVHWIDGCNEVQVRERYDLSDAELNARWKAGADKSLARRTKLPKVIRNLRVLEMPPPVGKVTISYLSDIGLTRDVWMHRVDISVALGREMDVDAAHDGRLVSDMVAEWARTHNDPFTMTLTGPAGGHFVSGNGAETVELDAIEFCRIISGRADGTGILAHPLPL